MPTKRGKNRSRGFIVGWSAGDATGAEPYNARTAQGSVEDTVGPDRAATRGS